VRESHDALNPVPTAKAFQKKGDKIFLFPGTEDQLITERKSENCYQLQLDEFSQSTLDGFLKFYVVPGMNHGGGTFNGRYDALSEVVNAPSSHL
jgi:UDP-2,3-diacylglucosamine pyrophosphatase LpxH